MAILLNHQPITLPTGTQEFGPFVIQDATTEIVLRLARNTTLTPLLWPLAATLINLHLDVSVDGGVNYALACGFGSLGGLLVNRRGGEVTESVARCTFPSGIGRLGKAILTVENGPLVSLLTVEIN